MGEFSDEEFKDAVTHYFAKYKVAGELRERAEQLCHHPLFLRILSEVSKGEDLKTQGDVGYLELITAYQLYKAEGVRRRLGLARPEDVERQITAVAEQMLAVGSPLLDESQLRQALRDGGASDDKNVLEALCDEEILLQAVFGLPGAERQFGFTFDELLEYNLANAFYRQHSWFSKNESQILADVNTLTEMAKQFRNIVGTTEYLILRLEQMRTTGLGLSVLERLSKASIPWRVMVARCITKLQDPAQLPCLSILRRLAQDPMARVRTTASWAVGSVGKHKPQAAFDLVEDLVKCGPIFGRDVLPYALVELVKVEQDRSIRLLQALSKDKEPYVRRVLAWNLDDVAQVAPEQAMALLRTLTTDEDWWVRRAAAQALASTTRIDLEASMALLSCLIRDKRTYVRWSAASALAAVAETHPDKALEMLRTWSQSDDAQLREAVALALQGVEPSGSVASFELLGLLARDANDDVREATADSLARATSRNLDGAKDLLIGLAGDSSHSVRREVASRITSLGTSDAALVIEVLTRHPLRPTVRELISPFWKLMTEGTEAIIHLSPGGLAITLYRLGDAIEEIAYVDLYSVGHRVARSLAGLLRQDPEQGTSLISKLAANESDEIRQEVAVSLGLTEVEQGDFTRETLAGLTRDSSEAIQVAASRSQMLLTSQPRARGLRRLGLSIAIGGITGAVMSAVLAQLIGATGGMSAYTTGLNQQRIWDVVLGLCAAIIVIGTGRVWDGFGRRELAVGSVVGMIVAILVTWSTQDIRLAGIGFAAAATLSLLFYDLRFFFGRRANALVGYYAAIGGLVTLLALACSLLVRLIGLGLPWSSLLIGALCGMGAGLLRWASENDCWAAIILTSGTSVLFVIGFWAILAVLNPVTLSYLSRLVSSPGSSAAVATIILSVLTMTTGVVLWLIVGGERYRKHLSRAALIGVSCWQYSWATQSRPPADTTRSFGRLCPGWNDGNGSSGVEVQMVQYVAIVCTDSSGIRGPVWGAARLGGGLRSFGRMDDCWEPVGRVLGPVALLFCSPGQSHRPGRILPIGLTCVTQCRPCLLRPTLRPDAWSSCATSSTPRTSTVPTSPARRSGC